MARLVAGTFTADGESETLVVQSPEFGADGAFIWLGAGAGTNFGGGTVTVQMQTNGGGFFDLPLASYTSETAQQIMVPNNSVICLNLSGATSPDLDYEIMCMSMK